MRNRNRVEMAVEDDRRAGPVALQPPEDDWRRREALVEELDLQSDFLEPSPVEPRDLGSVAGRALDLDELQGQVAQAIGFDTHKLIMTVLTAWPGTRDTDGATQERSAGLRAILGQGVVERFIQRHRASLLPRLGECLPTEYAPEVGDVRFGIGPPGFERVEAHGIAEHACARIEA